jgi:hypothetical protein
MAGADAVGASRRALMLRRQACVVGIVLLGIVAGTIPAAAQDSSPSASPAATDAPSAGVPYTDSQGVTRGRITIRSLEDPFAGFDPAYPPLEGERFVLLTVAFDAADDQQFAADPGQILLQDGDGYLRRPVTIYRLQPVTVPDFQPQTLGPGDRVSGAIGYAMPTGATLTSVLFAPEGGRLVPLRQGAGSEPRPVGTAVEAVDAAGVSHGTVTVREVADPYTEFPPASPPPEGTRYVLLSLVFEAAEDQTLWADPAGIALQDTQGFIIGPSGVPRPPEDLVPDLQAQTLAPGDRVSGRVGFIVPAAAEIASVLWAPESSRLVTIAEVGTSAGG